MEWTYLYTDCVYLYTEWPNLYSECHYLYSWPTYLYTWLCDFVWYMLHYSYIWPNHLYIWHGNLYIWHGNLYMSWDFCTLDPPTCTLDLCWNGTQPSIFVHLTQISCTSYKIFVQLSHLLVQDIGFLYSWLGCLYISWDFCTFESTTCTWLEISVHLTRLLVHLT